MNIILFKPEEIDSPLSLNDQRAIHILQILKLDEGDTFKAGIVNGSRGFAKIIKITFKDILLHFNFDIADDDFYPVHLIMGLPRPQTAKKILLEAASLGAASIWFTDTELGEKSYRNSKIWQDENWVTFLKHGAQQAYSTRLPEIRHFYSLKKCLDEITGKERIAFDNSPGALSLQNIKLSDGPCFAAIGSERGWTEKEKLLLGEYQFQFFTLGKRIVRCETACVGAIYLILHLKKMI